MPPKGKHKTKTTADSQITAAGDVGDAVESSHVKQRQADQLFDSDEPVDGRFT